MLAKTSPDSRLPLEQSAYHYPNKMGRIVLTAIEDIIGRHGVNAILNRARLPHLVNNYPPNNLSLGFSFAEFGAIQDALEDMFGVQGGRGLSMRAGRESFKYALREFMPVLGIADLAFRPFPLGMKIKIGLEVFAETFNKFTDQIVRLEQDTDKHLWIIERCPVCWNRESDKPCCHLAVGLLRESLSWVSNGKHYQVTEIQCVASGDTACVIAIDKKPLS